MGRSIYNAVISGRAGIAMLADGADTFYLPVDGESPSPVPAEDFHRLFGAARDFEFLEESPLSDVRERLQLANRREQAIDLTLILLDDQYPHPIRRETANDLVEMIRDKQVVEQLEHVFFSAPLPDAADLAGALAIIREAHPLVADWLERLGNLQPTIILVVQTWKSISEKECTSASEIENVDAAFVRCGVYREIVAAIEDERPIGQVAFALMSDSALGQFVPKNRLRRLLRTWATLLQEVNLLPVDRVAEVAVDRVIEVALTDTYGKFSAGPFERGLGMTIGNSLRRVLLSSVEGSAVTQVRIQGIQHAIATIPGVVEDVTDIILNIKSLVVKNVSERPTTIRIDRHGKGTVKAAEIQHDESIQILNPEHIIATLTDDVPFVVEMTVENGRGYRTSDENAGKDRIIGDFPVDSSFSPVVRVKYEVEATRVGPRTKYDRLVLEIWTNGTITPRMALAESARILRKHLNPFVQYMEPGMETVIDDQELDRKLNMSLAELELSDRAMNSLESEGITTVRDLVLRSEDELLEVRKFGETTLREVKSKLIERGLILGMKIPSGTQR